MIISIIMVLFTNGFDGFQPNPATKQTELRIISEAKEIEIGEGAFYVSPDERESVQEYVQKVGQRLAAASDRPDLPYEFVVMDDDQPNAWCLPGGKIAITRGFLLALTDEAQLAAILAHEIAHANLRHGAKQMERGYVLGAFNGALAVVGELLDLNHSRADELEADYYGIKFMQAAGYDPRAAWVAMDRMLTSHPGEVDLLHTHPSAEKRMASLEAAIDAQMVEGGEMRHGEEEYQKVIKQLI